MHRNLLLIFIVTLAVLFLPAFMGGNMVDDLPEEDEDDLTVINNPLTFWIQFPIHQPTSLLKVGISIFTLFVVYLGGRSKHRRFNDRTIDPANVLTFNFLKTAPNRAVFDFLHLVIHLAQTRLLWNHVLNPIIILSRRSKRL